MLGLIGIEQHRISCIIGIYENEREQEQDIYVDLQVETNFQKCVKSDQIQDTIDYVLLAQICTEFAKSRKYQLLETFAHDVLYHLLLNFEISWAWIKVKKPKALPTALNTTIEFKRYQKDI